ncbi:MAG: alpha/beta fold hydrolase [Candidatus Latescibacterota bacterium]
MSMPWPAGSVKPVRPQIDGGARPPLLLSSSTFLQFHLLARGTPMCTPLRLWALVGIVAASLAGCADDDGGSTVVGPGLEPGSGRIFTLKEVTFPSSDGVPVSASYAPAGATPARPVVILVHDLTGTRDSWLQGTSLFVDLLERGYLVVAVDLRGYGGTPLPEGRQVPLLEDLENSYLDVEAALSWLEGQPEADIERVAVVGDGSGGNVAYVSMGVFRQQIRTAVTVSAGLWERQTLRPVVVGARLDPFDPRSMLFMAGGQDVLSGDGVTLSYADFARALAASTDEPKSVLIFEDSADHGLDLLNNVPEAADSLLLWLEERL